MGDFDMTAMASVAQSAFMEQNALVDEYGPLVKRIAYHRMRRLPSCVQADDLIQAGMIGLLEASRNYDATQGASFETYAGIRIRGAMLDEVRKSDWAPRSLHRKVRQATQAMRDIEAEEGRDARDAEVAERLGLPLRDYHQILRDASGHRVFSLDDLTAAHETIAQGLSEQIRGPVDELEMSDFREALAEAISGLPERERLVMCLYYDEELNLREIGAVLGVSESRICQIHGQAMLRMKARMREWRTVGV